MHVAQANTGVAPSTPNLLSLFCAKPAFSDARYERPAHFQTNDRNKWSDIYRNGADEFNAIVAITSTKKSDY